MPWHNHIDHDWASLRDFYRRHYFALYRHTIPEASSQVAHILEVTGLQPPARIADLGCGFGRHTIVLAAGGFQVIAVDFACEMLSRARRHDWSGNVLALCADLRALPLKREPIFDAALLLFFTLSHFSLPQQRGVLSAVRQRCRSGAWLVVEVPGPAAFRGMAGRAVWQPLGGGPVVVDRRISSDAQRVVVERKVFSSDGQRTYRLWLYPHGPESIRAALAEAGWQPVKLEGDWGQRDPADASSLLAFGRAE